MLKKFLKKKKKNLLFRKQFKELKRQEFKTDCRFNFEASLFMPILDEATSNTNFDRHYVYHPAWAARVLKSINPVKHIDISSTLHFCSIVSTFIPVDFYDYRPANLLLSNLKSFGGDLMNLPFENDSIESISCMHTIEHIGLGRYGDQLDYDGDIKAIKELIRVTAINGNLLFVVPMDYESKIFFNAHRKYNKHDILNLFQELTLQEFAFIPDDEKFGGLMINPTDDLLNNAKSGCGCFWFKKTKPSYV